MRVEKTSSAHMPFKDHFKKQESKKEDQKKLQKKKKAVDVSDNKKDSNFIGWA